MAAAVLRLLAEWERGCADSGLLQLTHVAAAVALATTTLTAGVANRPDGPAASIATAVRAVFAILFRDAQTYKSGTAASRSPPTAVVYRYAHGRTVRFRRGAARGLTAVKVLLGTLYLRMLVDVVLCSSTGENACLLGIRRHVKQIHRRLP